MITFFERSNLIFQEFKASTCTEASTRVKAKMYSSGSETGIGNNFLKMKKYPINNITVKQKLICKCRNPARRYSCNEKGFIM